MKTLKDTYRRNTYEYHLRKRTDKVAMYEQMDGKRSVAFEVGYVKVNKESSIGELSLEGGECFWSNEDVGRIAWSILDRNTADKRFDELVESAKAKKPKAA